MALSDTARRILTAAAQHPLCLAAPPEKLPAAACQSVLNSLLKQGYVDACAVPKEYISLGWRQLDGAWTGIRISETGMAAIGAKPVATATQPGTKGATADVDPAEAAQELCSAPPAAPEVLAPPTGTNLAQPLSKALAARPTLRDAAHRLFAAWNDEAGERAGLADAIADLRAILLKTAPAARATGNRQPREGTKQQLVLAMLRRPEGATVAQITDATRWKAHTVRGFFAGLKRRQGITAEAAERVRQVRPGKEGAKGSYTVYRIAKAG